MNNHRTKLLVVASVLLWSFLGSDVLIAQDSKGSSGHSSSPSQILKGMAAKFKKRAIANKSAAVKKAYYHGWKITEELPGGGFRELQEVGPDGTPLYKESFNEVVVKTTRADYLSKGISYDFGVDGTGMLIGVWDSGKALPEHQEFNDRITAGDQSPRISGHATHVLGTAIASGVDPKAKGVAFNADGISFDWNQDEGEVAEQAAEGLLISNHSYGLSGRNLPDWYFGAYINQAQDWDEIMHAAPYYLMVTAAGNTQHLDYNDAPLTGTSTDGYDLLLGFAVAKNGLTVAAADKIQLDGNGRLIGADIASFSNFGPADDGRIKPDITGAGVNVYSSYSESDASYKTLSGTSMASPGVAGALLLLQQYYELAFGTPMKAATLKGLALHTADEVGDHPGPDPKFGWGILNSKRAAEVIEAVDLNSRIEEKELKNGEEFAMKVTVAEGETLSVSISWTDPAFSKNLHGTVNDPTRVLVNDLDLRIVKDGEVYYPWKLDLQDLQGGAKQGDNLVDPYEKIEIADASGEYKIIVNHKDDLSNLSQDFSLIITGIAESGCAISIPDKPAVDEVLETEATLSWNTINDAFYEVRYKTASEESWETLSITENQVALQGLTANTEYILEVRTFCSALMNSEFSAPVTFTTLDPDDPGDGGGDDPGDVPGTTDPEFPEVIDVPDPVDPGEEEIRSPGSEDDEWASDDELNGPFDDGINQDENELILVHNYANQTISISGGAGSLGPWYLTDSVGRIIKSGNNAAEPIVISDLSAGMYLVIFENSGKQKVKKFVK